MIHATLEQMRAWPCHDVILDSINEGVFTVNREWRITAFNRAAERILGVSREDVIGLPCCEVFRADICEKACALRRTQETGSPVLNATAHIVSNTGRKIPIRMSTALLRDENGEVVGGVETFQDLSQVEELRKKLEARYTFADIVGRSPAMRNLFTLVPQIAGSDSTVLIEGPSGTGKELVARALHNFSPRKDGPFVAIHCGALPDTLLESELFGCKAGAYTDARRDRPGRFAAARGGTIFLDEIGDVSPSMQVRLLRVLQERAFEPLGSVETVRADVRVIAATHRDLGALVSEGSFREDLYYRIRVIHLRLPPLRERREDVPLLIDHLVAKFNRLQGKEIAGVSDAVLARLMTHDFPGNVRELENIIEQAFVLCDGGLVQTRHLPMELRSEAAGAVHPSHPQTLRSMEKALIEAALRRHQGNRKRTAADLGIDTSTLYRKIQALGIHPPPTDGRSRRH